MEKIIYLARKLKAFTFEDIFMLAEMRKDALEQNLAELVKNGILKQDSQGYVFIDFKQQNNTKEILFHSKSEATNLSRPH